MQMQRLADVKNDSSNLFKWGSLEEIRVLFSQVLVEFKHVGRLANAMADALPKQGVDIVVPLISHTL